MHHRPIPSITSDIGPRGVRGDVAPGRGSKNRGRVGEGEGEGEEGDLRLDILDAC